ncbi:uncharacterized protein EI90DRAFT_694604 [Cantharellus anzutake]|uniref:uncharacterized protein n=1 Tax=Cantharellus anzutake TaxID=1750568 RepID=UPI0019039293|nr:uncharacterized protein EI90DRAFT_694604 [Cantharellus anzutake]KAF8332722.1 hypothetical protein EI90DRAFT_694604 [Cantharellus anzutake]
MTLSSRSPHCTPTSPLAFPRASRVSYFLCSGYRILFHISAGRLGREKIHPSSLQVLSCSASLFTTRLSGDPPPMNDISSINEVEYSEKTGLAHYESEVERLDAALTKCSGDIRKIPVAMGLVDAIDKLQNRSHRVSGLMRSIICPVWGAASQNKNRMCSFPPEILPLELEALAHALDGFNTALRVLPGFNHIQSYAVEKVHQSLHAFKQDLQYRSYSMRQFPESFHRNAMRYYISTIAEEMSHQSHDVADALEVFFESVSSSVSARQTRKFPKLLAFSGYCRFLSLSPVRWSSTLWISSDVTPHWWTSAWILNAPLVLLLVSVASSAIITFL